MKKILRYAIVMVATLAAQVCHGQAFVDFFVEFFSNPQSQCSSVQYPIRIGGSYVQLKSGWQPIRLKNNSHVSILYADSMEAAIGNAKAVETFVVDPIKMTGTSYTFARRQLSWQLTKSAKLLQVSAMDKSFFEFLRQYSTEAEFQKRHTIYPIKNIIISRESRTEKSFELYMPKTWQHINFIEMMPQVACLGQAPDESNNRQIAVYEGTRIMKVYSFICMRGKWFLIQIESYE